MFGTLLGDILASLGNSIVLLDQGIVLVAVLARTKPNRCCSRSYQPGVLGLAVVDVTLPVPPFGHV